MSITDKTRKILWGKSGNRCAICKKELIIDKTTTDQESVVGEECHIVSSKPKGPRCNSSFDIDSIDLYSNLILLCCNHHKEIDDQTYKYTTKKLIQIKIDHENWVNEKLDKKIECKIKRDKKNIPVYLSRLSKGKQVFDIISNSMMYSLDHDELDSQSEVDIVGCFLQTIQDWGDLSGELETGERVQATFNINELLKIIEEKNFYVFGAREMMYLEGGNSLEPSNWPVAIIRIIRQDNDSIIYSEVKPDCSNKM